MINILSNVYKNYLILLTILVSYTYQGIHANIDNTVCNITRFQPCDTIYADTSNADTLNLTKRLYYSLLNSLNHNNSNSFSPLNRKNYFNNYANKTIVSIEIYQLEIFGTYIDDTSQFAESWAQKFANKLHLSTNKNIIKKNLIIDVGERLDPFICSDNERILRSLPFIQDARILVNPIAPESDSVEIIVITKDIWPVGGAYELIDVGYGRPSVWNDNLMGLGHKFKVKTVYDINDNPIWGYNANYSIPNIIGTFTRLSAEHGERGKHKITKINLEREFYAPHVRFAGGYTFENKISDSAKIFTIDSTYVLLYHKLNTDGWLGYSLPIQVLKKNDLRESFFASIRYQGYRFFNRPSPTEQSFYDFQNREIGLLSLGLTWQGFHDTRYMYGFGKTEDLPYGAMFKVTAGKEFGEFYNRLYSGLELSWAAYSIINGYLTNKLEFGSYFNNKNMEQGIIHISSQHITPLLGTYRHMFRWFNMVDYKKGINRYPDELIYIKEQHIKGLDYNLFRGTERLSYKTELTYYSPLNIKGFRMFFYTYGNFAILNHRAESIINSPVYISTGLGVRIKNEKFSFNTIDLFFTLFPNAPGVSPNSKTYYEGFGVSQSVLPEITDRKPSKVEFGERYY